MFVLPLLPGRETFSIATLEAMACGLPVVATAVGSMAEMVTDGRDGFIVRPDAPDQLADRLIALLAEPDRARAMGNAGRERVERDFTLDCMTERYTALFRRVA
jgi:glycosyltransferase involved in cell wall biosynthesis